MVCFSFDPGYPTKILQLRGSALGAHLKTCPGYVYSVSQLTKRCQYTGREVRRPSNEPECRIGGLKAVLEFCYRCLMAMETVEPRGLDVKFLVTEQGSQAVFPVCTRGPCHT